MGVEDVGGCGRKWEVCGIMCFVENMNRRGRLCVGREGGSIRWQNLNHIRMRGGIIWFVGLRYVV